jgi:predicted xylose isomerase-like sugar epimerase
MKGGRDEEALVKRKPVAVQALAVGLGIEILKVDAVKVVWRWSNETKERTSMLDDAGEAFRTGRVWRRLTDFEKVR